MADELFSIDDMELKKWARVQTFERQSQIRRTIRGVLNDQAFEVRDVARSKVMPKEFNIRSKWATNSILVDKAKGNDTDTMFSEVGAKKRWGSNPSKDFLGLEEQEFGTDVRKPTIETSFTRSGGTFPGKVKKAMRLDNFLHIRSSDTYGSGWQNIITMLRILSRSYNGAFRITQDYPKLKRGVYVFKGEPPKNRNKIRPVKLIADQSNKTAKMKKKPWLQLSVKKAITKSFIDKSYKKWFKDSTSKTKGK